MEEIDSMDNELVIAALPEGNHKLVCLEFPGKLEFVGVRVAHVIQYIDRTQSALLGLGRSTKTKTS